MTDFKEIPLGRAKDLKGQTFGYLTPLYRIENTKNNRALWACKCKCGNIISVIGTDLSSGHTTSCGCKNKESKNVKTEIGNKYGKLIVIERAGSTSDRHALWKCKCECGNEIIASGKMLRTNQIISCGCYQKEKAKETLQKISSNNFIDETNNRYGKLVVVKKSETNGKHYGTLWECKCDCGNTKITYGDYLRRGIVTSCGCLSESKGEFKIAKILEEENIKFKKEYVIIINNIKYRYDFAILADNNNILYFIEFDGKQHFKSNEFFGGKKQFEKTIKNDNIKNNYCLNNNIPLIRIPYTKLDNLTINDLLLKEGKFVLNESKII